MSDWEESTDAMTVDHKTENIEGGETQRRRRNDDQQNGDDNEGGRRRNFNNQNNDDGGRRTFNRDSNDQNRENSQGGFRRRNQDQSNDNNQGDQGFRRRRDQNDDQGQSNDNQENGGGFRRRRNDDNQQDSNADFGGRRNRNESNDNDMLTDQQGGGERRRRNRDDNNQDANNENNDQAGGSERRRRNREENGEPAPDRTGEGGDGPKERYIPRTYNKEDEDLFETVGEGINFQKFDKIPVQVSGRDIPEPIQRFSEIAKDPSVVEAVKKSGYQTLTPIQKYGISIIMNGRDLMASAQTGSGKTMAFLLPIVQNLLQDPSCKQFGDKCTPQALIITPTRELAIQIYEQAMKLTFKNHLKPCVVYGGTNFRDQKNRIEYGANIIVATPGRLNHFLEKEMISLAALKYFVLDEADRMIDQGFIPAVKRVVEEFDIPKERHTLMFSATFPNEVQLLAQQFLKPDYIFLSVGILGAANADVKQEIRQVEFRNKKDELVKILKDIYSTDERILIFCEKKKMADFLAANLCDRDFKTTSIHGDRLQSQREQALSTFKKGETPILVATSVAARGLDIKGVGYVINYDLPKEIEEYVHRIGRTGRVGNSGIAISFYCERDDSPNAAKLAKLLIESGQKVPDFLASYDDGTTFASDMAEKDTRHNKDDDNSNLTKRMDNYSVAAAAEDDDW